ncbi:DedA family protein [Bifidobacterium aquikefiricola]|uniref:DedA family protein n=1 Tax=Bifidobacterium aquikefiricola TaxID=3059038 RepID=A0AB39U5A4_9BIFI
MNPTHIIMAASSCTTEQSGIIGTITEWLVEVMHQVGGVGVTLAIALESIFPPIPSEVILPLAGFTASQGKIGLLEAIVTATLGSLLGAWTLYGVSRWIGFERLERIATRIPGVKSRDLEKANHWFEKYGTWSVLIGRVIPVVRSLISIPAGLGAMNFWSFTAWTLLGSAVWNSLLIGFGFGLGEQWCSILGVIGIMEDAVIVVAIVVIVLLVGLWVRNLIRERHGSQRQ